MASTRTRTERHDPTAGPLPTARRSPPNPLPPGPSPVIETTGEDVTPTTALAVVPGEPAPLALPPPASTPATDPKPEKPSLHATHLRIWGTGDARDRPGIYVEVIPKATRWTQQQLLSQCKQRRHHFGYPVALFITPFCVHFMAAPHCLLRRDGEEVLTASFGDAWSANDDIDATLLGGTHMLWSLAGFQPPQQTEGLAGQVEAWLRVLPTDTSRLLPHASGTVGLARAWLRAIMARYAAMGIVSTPGLPLLPHWFEDDVAPAPAPTKKRRLSPSPAA